MMQGEINQGQLVGTALNLFLSGVFGVNMNNFVRF